MLILLKEVVALGITNFVAKFYLLFLKKKKKKRKGPPMLMCFIKT